MSFSRAAKLFFTGRIRSLHFVRVIRSASWRSDPFSHPSGSSARSAALPFLSLKAVFLFPLLDTRAQLGVPSPENVQCRAVFIQYARIVAPGPQRAGPVQHLVDSRRGRIASKFISTAISACWSGRAGASNQSWRAYRHTLAPACPRSPQIYFLTPGNIRPAS